MHVLVDVGAIGAGEILLLVDHEQHRVDEVGTGGSGRGIDAEQQVHLVLDRHFHRVLLDRRFPAGLAHAGRGSELDRRALYLGIGLGDRGRLLRGLGHALLGEIVGGRKAPRACHDHADAGTDGLCVDHVLHLVFAGDHELAQIPADAHIAIARTTLTRGGEAGIGQALLAAHIEGCQQLLGGNGLAEVGRHDQPTHGQPGQGQEITSLHGELPTSPARCAGIHLTRGSLPTRVDPDSCWTVNPASNDFRQGCSGNRCARMSRAAHADYMQLWRAGLVACA
nr:hypothetical protein [Xanthomonas campestris]